MVLVSHLLGLLEALPLVVVGLPPEVLVFRPLVPLPLQAAVVEYPLQELGLLLLVSRPPLP